MKKIVSQDAIDIYTTFKEKRGSEFISKPVSIDFFVKFCKKENPQKILELGAGIGTISYTLLKYSDSFIDMYEENDFCKDKLKENLSEFKGRYHIIPSYKMLPPKEHYDLIVVDGGGSKKGDTGYTKAIYLFIRHIRSLKVIYFEGSRKLQQIWARKALKERFIYTLTKHKPIEIGGEHLIGGTEYRCKPVRSFLIRYINYLFVEVREWYPIKYFLKYNLKKIKSLLSAN